MLRRLNVCMTSSPVCPAESQVGTLEATKVKILLMGEDSNPQSIRVELASEGDLFFHYMHVCDEGSFQLIQVCVLF